jgi:hypothetical protein
MDVPVARRLFCFVSFCQKNKELGRRAVLPFRLSKQTYEEAGLKLIRFRFAKTKEDQHRLSVCFVLFVVFF